MIGNDYIMAPKNRDLTDQRFGKLVVLKKVVYRGFHAWHCRCDCGKFANVREKNLVSKHTRSCGCLRREIKPALVHGRSHELEYASWRTLNRQAKVVLSDRQSYPVDPRWAESYEAFYADMGPKPNRRYRLTRKDKTLGFNKENCYWRKP